MEAIETGIEGLLEFHPQIFGDDRGWFLESFNEDKYNENLPKGQTFIQDNISCSKKGVIRGLHFQTPPFAQAKLVCVLMGSALDIAVDLRKDSSTYGQSYVVVLSSQTKNQLYVPRGFAHGFASLEDGTIFSYKCDNPYSKAHERTLQWNDPILNIDWVVKEPILTKKDMEGQAFSSFQSPF